MSGISRYDKPIRDALVGRRIVKAEPRRFRSMNAGSKPGDDDYWAHDWLLTLDDGQIVFFVTEETETGEYGTDIIVTKRTP